jgi:hypothetical protein
VKRVWERPSASLSTHLSAAFVSLTALLVPLTAQGEPARFNIPTHVDPCVPIDLARFKELLAVELGAIVASTAPAEARRTAATVTLTCMEEQIQLTLDDAVTRKTMTRRVDLSRIDPSTRTRLMALTVAEFVLASWLEMRLAPTDTLEPVGPRPSAAIEQQASRMVEPRLQESAAAAQLGASFELLAFSSSFRLIPCVALHSTVPISSALALRIGLSAGRSSLDGYLDGSREQRPVTLRLTVGSLLLALLYSVRFADLDVVTGLGARMGVARLAGVQLDDASVVADASYAPWAGPLVSVGLGYHVSRDLRLSTTLEAGLLALRARAVGPDEVTVTALRDAWLGASVSLEWRL